ncbi:hypothetical protein GCM10008014_15480 [Paenibacillus silvae]|uniref:Carrier domain-containing protein n=1 Tax=Paenibacillus silvae TaxID=1325358 RepID=A0ABQ1Z4V8_9BACL|nr:non-ribosomal peptide synthetase [Paenibacillus silvae]GGH50396.1 hypothetical protein GCM10008014_15480 [Paenibacillus silvae]
MALLFDKQLKKERDYWLEKLSGEVSGANFILDHLRPTHYVEKRSVQKITIGHELYAKVRELSKESPFLTYVFLMTAVKICLFKYAEHSCISVGSPARKMEINSHHIAPNLVTIVDRMEEQTILSDLLKQIRTTLLDAYKHQSYPFENVLSDLNIDKNQRNSSIFNIILAYSKIHGEIPDYKNDITLTFTDHGDTLVGELMYNTSLFRSETINRFSQHFMNALSDLVNNNQITISDVNLLSEDELQQVLVDWNQNKADFSVDESFHKLFEDQVLKTPHQVAVCFEEQKWTYSELNSKANCIARALIHKNLEYGSVVPLLAERSGWFLAAVIGIFKAGGAYLPLDPAHPEERLSNIIKKSESSIVLVTSDKTAKMKKILENAAGNILSKFLIVDELLVENQDERNTNIITGPDHLSYVLFTSGSTGEPKGVMIEQAGMMNHLELMIRDFEIKNQDVVAQTASQCFDISVWQFLSPLLVGAKVHILNNEVTKDPEKLFQEIESNGVQVMQIVPSFLRAFLNGLESGHFSKMDLLKLKWLSVTGEAFPPDIARKWFDHYSHIPLMNAYGPSECSDDVTLYPIYESPPENVVNIPIGKAIPNLQIYILDSHLRPVPIGVTGEIYVGGVGVGRGYLNDLGKTNAAFLGNPFVDDSKARLYKTGDLGRYLSDGNLEYVGRTDYQVKVRGYRIELGEIEAVLRQYPDIIDVAVMVRNDVGANTQIVSYVVCKKGGLSEEAKIKAFLKKRLPEYMVPNIFVWMESLPLTANGKLDYKALPKPKFSNTEDGHNYVAPRNYVEQALADIWAEVLKLDKVGIRSNFFELGGDSILSIQMAYKSKQVGLFFRPTNLLEHQTIEELSSVITDAKPIQAEQGLIKGAAPLTPVQEWFFEQEFIDANHWNQATFLKLRERIKVDVLQQSIKQLLELHDTLRSRFEKNKDGIRQVFQENITSLPFEEVDLKNLDRDAQDSMIKKYAESFQTSLDIWRGPLIRVVLFEMGANEHQRLLIIIHHLVVDGVSWRILLDDLQTIYQALRRGETPKCSNKNTSYKMWAERLKDYSNSTTVLEDLSNWMSLNRENIPSLPVDMPRKENKVDSARIVSDGLTELETKSLLQEVPSIYKVHINDILLTALISAFSTCFGQSSLLINMEGHGREDIFIDLDVSRTVGWFTAEFPLLLNLGPESLSSRISNIHNQLKHISQRGLHYGLLRYLHSEHQVREQLADLAKPEVSFNYLGQFNQGASVGSLFEAAFESTGSLRSIRGDRNYILDINGAVIEGSLRFNWEYSDNLHHRSTIESLAQSFNEILRSIIHLCSPKEKMRVQEFEQKSLISTGDTNLKSYPLSHMQKWFFDQNFEDSHYWNTAILLKPIRSLEVQLLKEAVYHVTLHHDIFCMRYANVESGWIQFYKQHEDFQIFEYVDFSSVAHDQQNKMLEESVNKFHSNFNLVDRPLIKVVLFDLGINGQRVFIVVHHLVIDHMSWSFLMEDIQTAYLDLKKDLVPRLPVTTTTYREWTAKLIKYAQSLENNIKLLDWVEEQKAASTYLPIDYPNGINNEESLDEFYFKLDVEDTSNLFQKVRVKYQMHIGDILLTAMALTLTKWKDEHNVLIDQGIHGRGDIFADVDLTRTVGWFTTSFPTKFEFQSTESIDKILYATKECLEISRQHGFNYAVIRSLSKNEDINRVLSEVPKPKVSFDYDGPMIESTGGTGGKDFTLWNIASESRGSVRSPSSKRCYEIDARSWLFDNEIILNWQFSTNLHEKSTIEKASELYQNFIKQIIASV